VVSGTQSNRVKDERFEAMVLDEPDEVLRIRAQPNMDHGVRAGVKFETSNGPHCDLTLQE